MSQTNYNNNLNSYGFPDDGNAFLKQPGYVDQEALDKLVGNAPEELDTLEELANAVQNGGGDLTEIREEIDAKADAETVNTKFDEIDAAMEDKADKADLEELATKEELEQVKTDVQNILQDAPEELDTLKEIADLLATKQDAAEVVDALSAKVDTADFETHVAENDEAFQSITETLGNKADKSELEGLADTEYVDGKVGEIIVPTNLSELNNDGNYVQDENYVHTDNNFTDAYKETLDNLEIPDMTGYVQDENYVHTDNNFTDADKEKLDGLENYDDAELSGRVEALETAGYVTMGEVESQNYTTMEAVEEMGYSTFDGNYSSLVGAPAIPVVPTNVSDFNNDAGYLTTTTADERYYEKEAANNIFIAKSQYEDDMELKADKTELGDYATDTEVANAVRELVVRLNKLEAQNAILVEKGTDSAEDIANMSAEDAANADVVVATDEAIEALATPKTFKNISVAGGEVGGDTVINLLANDSIDVNGLTVSGTKGTGNGKIIFGSNDVTISNMNIEAGCTVYNVFEGKQDKAAENCIDNFTATNIIVDDPDLKHNVFNIYQVNDGANILIKDSTFNLCVSNSNVLRMSNITNAKNVTITFENVDWTYENANKPAADIAWAGLMIYQPYGSDTAHDGNFTNVETWTVNVKDCRYNGEPITENLVGTIKQAVYQYDINGTGATQDLDVFGSVNFE